jgi:hypothetical protein
MSALSSSTSASLGSGDGWLRACALARAAAVADGRACASRFGAGAARAAGAFRMAVLDPLTLAPATVRVAESSGPLRAGIGTGAACLAAMAAGSSGLTRDWDASTAGCNDGTGCTAGGAIASGTASTTLFRLGTGARSVACAAATEAVRLAVSAAAGPNAAKAPQAPAITSTPVAANSQGFVYDGDLVRSLRS